MDRVQGFGRGKGGLPAPALLVPERETAAVWKRIPETAVLQVGVGVDETGQEDGSGKMGLLLRREFSPQKIALADVRDPVVDHAKSAILQNAVVQCEDFMGAIKHVGPGVYRKKTFTNI